MVNVVIVGAGRGGSSLLRSLGKMAGRIGIVGIADQNLEAPGMALAREMGVFTATDFRLLISRPEVDIIIQATGDTGLDDELRRLKSPRAVIIEGLAMNLVLSFVEEENRLLHQLEVKERERGNEVQALAEELGGLREMKVLLEAIFHATQDAISVVGQNGLGLMVNPAYTTLTGMAPEQVIGKPATVDIDPSQVSMHLQVLQTRRPVRGVHMQVGPKKRDVVVNVAPIIVDGELKGTVGVVHDVSEISRLSEELEQQKKLVRQLTSKYTFAEIIAESAVMQQAVEQAMRAAETPATVLLRGESGTGKELFAHAIHNASNRRRGQFIRVNCAALADSLLESELFGYADGAFTGARKGGKTGLFEEANGGTLFLDEIGEVSLSLQAKLLRVLQEKEIVRVGETAPRPVTARVIAATNAPLEELIVRGAFREDLYYRLNVVPILIPPLRHRREDLPHLVSHLIDKFNMEYGRHVRSIAPEALQVLLTYAWPGNVRELENIIGRAMIAMSISDTVIEARFVPPLGTDRGQGPPDQAAEVASAGAGLTLAEIVGGVERQVLIRTLEETGGNKTEAAKRLGIAPRTLYYKLERYGLM